MSRKDELKKLIAQGNRLLWRYKRQMAQKKQESEKDDKADAVSDDVPSLDEL